MNVFYNMKILIKPEKRCANEFCFVIIRKNNITFSEICTHVALEKSDVRYLVFPFIISAFKSSQIPE